MFSAVRSRFASLLAGLVLLFSSFPSLASISPSQIVTGYQNISNSIVYGLGNAPCEALGTFSNPANIPVSFSMAGSSPITFSCTYSSGYVGTVVVIPLGPVACPVNSTPSENLCTCNSGFQESGASCIPVSNPCAAGAGALKTLNTTIGYKQTTGDSGDFVGSLNQAVDVCSNGCTFGITFDPSSYYVSSAPTATGLYRVSSDNIYIQTGQQCTGTDASVNPAAPIPTCPGSVGQINGKTVCVGSGSSAIATTPTPLKPGSKVDAGNPSSGPQPTSGPGAGPGGVGRTPLVGDGGPAGGPSGAAAGSSSGATGTTTAPAAGEIPTPCGAPGQPVCAVKVDETGTPSGSGAMGGTALSDLEKAQTAAIALATKTGNDKNTSWGLVPRWLTSHDCSPAVLMTLPASLGSKQITFDICPYLSEIYLLMNFLWVVWTFSAITGMVFRVTTNSAD